MHSSMRLERFRSLRAGLCASDDLVYSLSGLPTL